MPWKRAERVRGGVCVWTEMVGMRVGPVRAVAARACVFVFSPPGAPQPEGWGTRAQRQKRARLPLPPPPTHATPSSTDLLSQTQDLGQRRVSC